MKEVLVVRFWGWQAAAFPLPCASVPSAAPGPLLYSGGGRMPQRQIMV